MSDALLIERDGRVATIINNDAPRNRMTLEFIDQLEEAGCLLNDGFESKVLAARHFDGATNPLHHVFGGLDIILDENVIHIIVFSHGHGSKVQFHQCIVVLMLIGGIVIGRFNRGENVAAELFVTGLGHVQFAIQAFNQRNHALAQLCFFTFETCRMVKAVIHESFHLLRVFHGFSDGCVMTTGQCGCTQYGQC